MKLDFLMLPVGKRRLYFEQAAVRRNLSRVRAEPRQFHYVDGRCSHRSYPEKLSTSSKIRSFEFRRDLFSHILQYLKKSPQPAMGDGLSFYCRRPINSGCWPDNATILFNSSSNCWLREWSSPLAHNGQTARVQVFADRSAGDAPFRRSL